MPMAIGSSVGSGVSASELLRLMDDKVAAKALLAELGKAQAASEAAAADARAAGDGAEKTLQLAKVSMEELAKEREALSAEKAKHAQTAQRMSDTLGAREAVVANGERDLAVNIAKVSAAMGEIETRKKELAREAQTQAIVRAEIAQQRLAADKALEEAAAARDLAKGKLEEIMASVKRLAETPDAGVGGSAAP